MNKAANTNNDRYAVAYGKKYEKGLDVAEIAKRVRLDLKAWVAAGELPACKFGVTISRYAGGRSLTVKLDEVPFALVNPEYVRAAIMHAPYDRDLRRLTPEAAALVDKVEALVDAYNFNGSDSQSDYFHVNFYAHVNFGSQESREYTELRARFEAEKAEADSFTRKANEAAKRYEASKADEVTAAEGWLL